MAYSLRGSAGAWGVGTPNTPTLPTRVAGDLLLCFACARLDSETITTPTGWTLLADTTSTANGTCHLFGRIATNDANDAITIDYSGTSNSRSQVAAFQGGSYTDLSTIVSATGKLGSTTNTVDLPSPAVTPLHDNCLVVAVGKKSKTTTSNGVTATSPAGFPNRIGQDQVNGTTVWGVWDYVVQTTAAAISADSWNQTPDESHQYASLAVALQLAPASGTIAPIASYYSMMSRNN